MFLINPILSYHFEMKKYFILFFIGILLYGCASEKNETRISGLDIKEVKPSKWTALVKQNILHLAQIYDLSPFLYTKDIMIQSEGNTHSLPMLTIDTRNAEKPHKLLAQLLHEEFHHWARLEKVRIDLAVKELKKIYKTLPKGEKKNPTNTYHHLIICYLEFKALSSFLGRKPASILIIETMKKDKMYPWVYGEVLRNGQAIEKIMARNNLLPSSLKNNKKTTAF